MSYEENYDLWLQKAVDDNDIIEELKLISNNSVEISDRFFKNLSFGTGGLRGVIGAGSNRMNIYTVRQASQGVSDWLLASGKAKKIAIAYDSRNKSELFAKEAAAVFCANGIDVALYPRLMPTPALSFAVRHLNCGAGVCITASHNPAEYNGYKVYDSDGCQITECAAKEISAFVGSCDIFHSEKKVNFHAMLAQSKINYIPEAVVNAFILSVLKTTTKPPRCALKVAYSPLNGAGLECVTRILKDIGIQDIFVVKEQELPDGNFPTCPYPNPEHLPALELLLALGKKKQADLLLATDPDCDRVGVAAKYSNGEYKLFTGNEIGILLLDYLCKTHKNTTKKPFVAISTIVTTDMAAVIADFYKIELVTVFTGFKNIGDVIGRLEKREELDRFLLGFEESCGYLAGSYVRDKDAVGAVMLICEMALWYKNLGKSLADAMRDLYETHGYFSTKLLSITFNGETGAEKMEALMERLHKNTPKNIGAFRVDKCTDYLYPVEQNQSEDSLAGTAKSDVVRFDFKNNASVIFRPSGTEPKFKIYLSARAVGQEDANIVCEQLASAVTEFLS